MDGAKNICKTCGKHFRSAQSLNYHNDNAVCRKNECIRCGKLMASKASLRYHTEQKVCVTDKKIKLNPKRKLWYSVRTIPYDQIDVVYVARSIKGFAATVFKCDSRDLIIPEFIKLFLCNKNMSEYWSVYMQNQSNAFIKVYTSDNGWMTLTKRQCYQDLTNWAINSLELFLDNYLGAVKDKNMKILNEVSLNIETDSKFKQTVHNEIYCALVNLKPLIVEKIKTNRKRNSGLAKQDKTEQNKTVFVNENINNKRVTVDSDTTTAKKQLVIAKLKLPN